MFVSNASRKQKIKKIEQCVCVHPDRLDPCPKIPHKNVCISHEYVIQKSQLAKKEVRKEILIERCRGVRYVLELYAVIDASMGVVCDKIHKQ